MLERGELSQVTANAELADRLMATARQHLASVRLLADSDPYLAYVAVYDAIRKALSALLQIQGLRATTSGGYLAIMHAVCRRNWHPALRAAGLPAIHFHDLRHAGNQFAADEGAN